MAQLSSVLGHSGATIITLYLDYTENWNSSTQVSMHIKVYWIKSAGSGANGTGSATWNANIAGLVNSGNWTYPSSSSASGIFWEFDYTFTKDANGYVSISLYAYANGDNGTIVTTASVSGSYSPARIGIPPTMNNPVASNIKPTTATISGTNADNGLGTSTTVYLRYKKTADSDATYQQLQTTSWNITGLKPGTSYTIQIYGVNNNGDTNGWQNTQTFKTKGIAGLAPILMGMV